MRRAFTKCNYLTYGICIFQKCSDSLISNKTDFPTFARTMQPSERTAKSIISVLKHYKWNRVVVLAGEQSKKFIFIKDAFKVRFLQVTTLISQEISNEKSNFHFHYLGISRETKHNCEPNRNIANFLHNKQNGPRAPLRRDSEESNRKNQGQD